MTTIRYKGRKRATEIENVAKDAGEAVDKAKAAHRGHVPPRPLPPRYRAPEEPTEPPKPKVAWPKKQHPRDRLNDQLRVKAPRTREVKHLSAAKPREERIAILVDIGRKRGTGVLLTEIETHERKIADLREAVKQLTDE